MWRDILHHPAIQAGKTTAPQPDYIITVDLDDGQVCPPYIEDGIPWRVVVRRNGRTLWCRGTQRVRP
jgi:hypothetical protein